jgi:hypothetical protein
VVELLDAKAAAVTEQLADLSKLKGELDRLRQQAAGMDPAECDARSVCEILHPSRG